MADEAMDAIRRRFLQHMQNMPRDMDNPMYSPTDESTIAGHYGGKAQTDEKLGMLQAGAGLAAGAGAFAAPELALPLGLAGTYEGMSGAGNMSDADKEAKAARAWSGTGLPEGPPEVEGRRVGAALQGAGRNLKSMYLNATQHNRRDVGDDLKDKIKGAFTKGK
jgi:hypothetical protein